MSQAIWASWRFAFSQERITIGENLSFLDHGNDGAWYTHSLVIPDQKVLFATCTGKVPPSSYLICERRLLSAVNTKDNCLWYGLLPEHPDGWLLSSAKLGYLKNWYRMKSPAHTLETRTQKLLWDLSQHKWPEIELLHGRYNFVADRQPLPAFETVRVAPSAITRRRCTDTGHSKLTQAVHYLQILCHPTPLSRRCQATISMFTTSPSTWNSRGRPFES